MPPTERSIPSIAFLPANMDACALYRLYIPHLNTPASRFVFEFGPIPIDKFSECQVVVVQRQVSPENLQALQTIRNYGMKIIYDLDDNMWNLPSANPGKKAIEAMQEGFAICAAACDLITVSTRGLRTAAATALHHLKQEIVVVPNAMDFNLFRPASVDRNDGRIVIGWQGSNTHGEDIRDCWAVLPSILEEFENVYMEFIGMPPPAQIRNHPRCLMRRWYQVGEYPSRLSSWGWDIALAPLVDNRFNRSKSCIKMMEAGAVGAACLASEVQPYIEFAALGGRDVEWALCTTPKQWKDKLRTLVMEPELRRDLAGKIKNVAEQFFNIDKIKENWWYAINQVL